MVNLLRAIDIKVTNFVSEQQRRPAVIRLGATHVQTLQACGALARTDQADIAQYNGIPIEAVRDPLHLSVA